MIIFAYINKDIDNNVKDVLDAMFAYVGKDIRDNFDVELENNIEDQFVKVVSILTMSNKIEDKFVDKIEDVDCDVKEVSI